jgi:hypothetical protein
MRKRLVRAVIFFAIATGIAVGVADAAGAVSFGPNVVSTDGSMWD